ncbi:kinetochore protein Mis13/DSN1 [Cryptococcus neoformans Ze90-1]|nr:kinetochore protein Mis13/DSN1 [Cryptococcus neoformans var. grubii Ze90-1]
MATRRSTRLSGELDASNKVVNGKRKGTAGGKDDGGEVGTKKKKQGGKKSTFQPQPVPLPNSSDTPPSPTVPADLPPPPPSVKIARRRESTRAIRERPLSESPPSGSLLEPGMHPAKKQKVVRGKNVDPLRGIAGTSDDPLNGVEETEAMRNTGSVPFVQYLTFSKSSKPRPSAPRPSSPPRRTFASSSAAPASRTPSASAPTRSGTMGPPTTFVRKTRKSMGRVQELSKDMVMPIMDSETPVIRKNQELRGQQARRSSMDHRGGRASSSWGRGDITMPHKSVDHKLFYRHIPTAYPDPIKTRMLLVWCTNRAIDENLKRSSAIRKGKGKQKEVMTEEGDRMLREVMEEFVQGMNRGSVDTNTYALPGQESASFSGLQPHPRNVQNRKAEAEMTSAIRKYKEEGAQWSAIVNATNNKQQETIRLLEKKMMINAEPDMSKAAPWMQQALALADSIIAEEDDSLQHTDDFEDVEYKVDTLHQTSHIALQYVLQASRFLDGIFSSLTADLRARDRLGLPPDLPPHDTDGPDTIALLTSARLSAAPQSSTSASASSSKQSTGKSRPDAMSLLRSLASVESKDQSDETVAAAAKVAPMLAISSMTPRRPAAGMTPRRHPLGAATPRGMKGMTPRPERE